MSTRKESGAALHPLKWTNLQHMTICGGTMRKIISILLLSLFASGCSGKMTVHGNIINYPDGSIFEVSSKFKNFLESYGRNSDKSPVLFTPQNIQGSDEELLVYFGVSPRSIHVRLREGWNEDIFYKNRGMMCGNFLIYYSSASGVDYVDYCIDGFIYSNLTAKDFKEKFKSVVVQKAGAPQPSSECVSGNCVNGQGTMTFPDGAKYVGEWKDGKKHGQGTMTLPNGAKYVGEWKDGKMDGQGTDTNPEGRKYVGEWKDGKMDGQGTMTIPDGRKYVGEWKDAKMDGQGTMYHPDGRKLVGEWKDGKFLP